MSLTYLEKEIILLNAQVQELKKNAKDLEEVVMTAFQEIGRLERKILDLTKVM